MSLTKITRRSLGTEEVQSNNLAPLSVTNGKIANGAITQEKLNVSNLDSLPIGTIIYYPNPNPPAGYLVADGSILSRTVYAALFSVIGTTFNIGGELTTDFRLPDLRGEFIRGFDNGRNVDPNRTFGSFEDWSTGRPKRTDNPNKLINNAGGGQNLTNASPPNLVGFARVSNVGETITSNGLDSPGSGWEMDDLNVVDGDEETRPRNIALQPCIKWTQLSNIANVAVDVNALAASKLNITGGTITGTLVTSQNPKFYVSGGPNQSTTGNTQLLIQFTDLAHNIGNGYSLTNHRFTAPRDGYYQFHFQGMCGGNSHFRYQLFKNTQPFGGERFAAASVYENFSGNWQLFLQTGEYVELRYGFAPNEVNHIHVAYRSFSGYLIP
jgi:phage-related tail fiber protein